MNSVKHIAIREMKIGFRNPWAYSFMALFALFMFSLLLINSQNYVSGYSSVSGTMLNLILYLLPLMTLMLGFFLAYWRERRRKLGTVVNLSAKYMGIFVGQIFRSGCCASGHRCFWIWFNRNDQYTARRNF